MGNGYEVASKVISYPSAFSAKPTVETPVSTFNVSLENRKEHSMANMYDNSFSQLYKYIASQLATCKVDIDTWAVTKTISFLLVAIYSYFVLIVLALASYMLMAR